MRTLKFVIPSALALAIGGACGDPTTPRPIASAPSASDVTTYALLAANVQRAAISYRATMMAPTTASVADCNRVHDSYDAQVRPLVSQMAQMRAAMDHYMDDHGGASVADFSCVSATMTYELDLHRATACTSADITTDRAEVHRHVDAVLSYAGHIGNRCNEIMRGVDAGHPNWEAVMSGCESWDGHGHCSMMYAGEAGWVHGCGSARHTALAPRRHPDRRRRGSGVTITAPLSVRE